MIESSNLLFRHEICTEEDTGQKSLIHKITSEAFQFGVEAWI